MARIVVIEDDPMFRHAVSVNLTRVGHRVTEARNGKEALQLLPAAHAELIIADIVAPETVGFEVLQQLQQQRPLVKVIVTLGEGCAHQTDCRELAKYLGAASVMAKPFSVEELLCAVNELLHVARPQLGRSSLAV
jgi:two-component system, chemotaxis family, sensor histidine kinase and response regulator PixL